MDEVIIPLPDRIEPTTKARGMMITNSILMLRERGLFDRWKEHATRPEEILAVTAGSWVPINLAEAHYLACERRRA